MTLLLNPDPSPTIVITPQIEHLIYLVCGLLSFLFAVATALIVKLWPVFRVLEQHKRLWRVVMGSKNKPGLARSWAQGKRLLKHTVERVRTIWTDVLRLSDPEMKRAMAAQALAGAMNENIEDPRAASGVTAKRLDDSGRFRGIAVGASPLPPPMPRARHATPFPTSWSGSPPDDAEDFELDAEALDDNEEPHSGGE